MGEIIIDRGRAAGRGQRIIVGDRDGVTCLGFGRMAMGEDAYGCATPQGIMRILEHYDIEIEGKHAVVVGRSPILGKPMAMMLLQRNATVTICHSRTRDLAAITRQAEILIAAAGVPALIGREHVADGAVVVDVGMHRVTDAAAVDRLYAGNPKKTAAFAKRGSVLSGDVDFMAVAPKASRITPVPGGVGPLTIAMLMANTVKAARLRRGL